MKKWNVLSLLLVMAFLCPLWAQLDDIATDTSTESRYGAHIDAQGWVHFVVYSPAATAVKVLFFTQPEDISPAQAVALQKSGDNWKIKVKGTGVGHGLFYMYQAYGPREVSTSKPFGNMFNENYYLNDPYAYCTQNVKYSSFFTALPYVDRTAPVYAGGGKSMVYNHSLDEHPGYVKKDVKDLIVYELHVQDYTARIASLDASKRGRYLGLAQSGLKTPGGLSAGLDHLVELGVNAVELMPVMEYDEETGNAEGRYNHWGYMTSNFFSPEARYASSEGEHIVEMKQLVKALHQRGLTVFMDVVYNHTAEQSPWSASGRLAAKYYNTMGFHNTSFYRSTSDAKYYYNNTGTGNDVSFAGGDSLYTKRWVNDSLALWYQAFGIDGFRFDLARILADGSQNAADWVDNDSRFTAAHLHAEPWDMGGQWWAFMDDGAWSYGNNRWTKWLGRYRDNIRRFSSSGLRNKKMFKQLVEGYGATDSGSVASSKPWRSINMLTCHDGYTLRDVVYYNDYDGSHNCWDSNGDENLRRERQKLMMGILLTSQGVPMILQGDEFGRTQSGALSQADAHNTYNYESSTGDNSINYVNWIDWKLKDGDNSSSPTGPRYGRELFSWSKNLIQLRKKWTHFRRSDFPEYVDQAWDNAGNSGSANDGRFSYSHENSDGEPTVLAVVWWGKSGEPDIMVVYNEHWDSATVNLKNWSKGNWKVLARSWYGEGNDFGSIDNWQTCPDAGEAISVKGRSLAILVSDNN